MSKHSDGGPAYPSKQSSEQFTYPGKEYLGLSLRDWFAGQALMGLIASNDEGAGDRITEIPSYAYDIAEAMLAAREK